MDESLRVTGYHATSKDKASAILNGTFKLSENDYDWLGDGAYFWQDAPVRAWKWADKYHGASPAVIASVIRLEDCIDLLDSEWMDELKALVPLYLQRFRNALPKQKGKWHRMDREFFNWVVGRVKDDFGADIKVIRAVFIEGEPLLVGKPKMDDSAIYDLSHVQIAVRDISVIEKSWPLERP